MPNTPRRSAPKPALQMRQNLQNCWDKDLQWELIPDRLKRGCFKLGKALSLPPLSILCGLMMLTSFAMSHSSVHVSETGWYEPVILWLVVVMPSGCGKSTLYKFLKKAVEKTRAKLQLNDSAPAWSAEEASMEKMGAMMSENGCKMLGLFDEFTHFLTQINVYKGKSLTDSQDLAMLLQLHNGLSWSRKTVSRECNFTMPLTSFTIGGFTQPMTASSIQCQSGSAEKGLSTRFLWVSPEPVFQSLDELGEVDEIFFDDYVSLLSNLMQARRNLDQQTRKILELNKEDCPSYCRVFNEIQQKLKSIAGYDDMITGMLSKSKGQILRVAGVFSVLFGIGTDDANEDITDVALAAAINFVEVSCDHAFFLASRASLKDEIESVILEATSAIPFGEEEPQSSAAVRNIKTHILLLPGKRLFLSPLLKKKKFRGFAEKDGVLREMEELEKLGLGKLESEKKPGKYVKYTFHKCDIPEGEEEKVAFTSTLTEVGVSIRQYRQSLDEPEILDTQNSGKRATEEDSAVRLRTSPRKSPRKN